MSVVLLSGERIESVRKQERASNSPNRFELPQNAEVIREVHQYDPTGAAAGRNNRYRRCRPRPRASSPQRNA